MHLAEELQRVAIDIGVDLLLDQILVGVEPLQSQGVLSGSEQEFLGQVSGAVPFEEEGEDLVHDVGDHVPVGILGILPLLFPTALFRPELSVFGRALLPRSLRTGSSVMNFLLIFPKFSF